MPLNADVMKQMKPFILQGLFFGALYKGAQGMRKYVQTQTHHIIAERPEIMFTPMRDTLSQIAMLGNDAGLRIILDKCCRLLSLSRTNDLRAPAQMSRLISEIQNDVQHTVNTCGETENDAKFRLASNCRMEVIPLFMTQLDDVLHNYLLERAPGR